MNLKIQMSDDGLPEINISFDQDTSDSEPYMLLKAYGFESIEEVAGTLTDVVTSLADNIPVPYAGHGPRYQADTEHIGEFRTPEAQAEYKRLWDARRPGESVMDVERRELREKTGATSAQTPSVQPKPRPPFNPQPRGPQR